MVISATSVPRRLSAPQQSAEECLRNPGKSRLVFPAGKAACHAPCEAHGRRQPTFQLKQSVRPIEERV
jgi:hypothetical protein